MSVSFEVLKKLASQRRACRTPRRHWEIWKTRESVMNSFRTIGMPCLLWAGSLGALALVGALEYELGPVLACMLFFGAASIGAFGAWLSYDPRGVALAIKASWNEVVGLAWSACIWILLGVLGPIVRTVIAGASLGSTIALCCIPILAMDAALQPQTPGEWVVFFGSIMTVFGIGGAIAGMHELAEPPAERLFSGGRAWKFTLFSNPVGLTFLLGRIVFKTVTAFFRAGRWLYHNRRKVRKGTGRFVRLTFIRLNCSERHARAFGTFSGVLGGCLIGHFWLNDIVLGTFVCAAIGFLAGSWSFRYADRHRSDIPGHRANEA